MNKFSTKTVKKSYRMVYSTKFNTERSNSIKVYEPNRVTDVTINSNSSLQTIKKEIEPLLYAMQKNDVWHFIRKTNPKLLLLMSLQFCTYDFLLNNNIKVEDAVKKLKFKHNPNLISKFSKND
jgi:hypothetical protein